MRLRLLLFFSFLAMSLPADVSAHRLQTILSTISYNPNTRMMEIVHQTHAHDVEFALINLSEYPNGLENIRAQALAGLILARDFHLWDASGNEIELQLVGAELEADIFYIYQEAGLAAIPESMQIEHRMLMNRWTEMQNYVNVDYDNGIKSLSFGPSDRSQYLSRD
jgi:hypothetical protein